MATRRPGSPSISMPSKRSSACARHARWPLAAKKLSLTQPAVSQAVADLETRIGVKLFDRSVRPLALTPAGEVMRQRASALVSEARQIATAIRHTARGRLALIRAGLVDSLSRALTGPIASFLAEPRRAGLGAVGTDRSARRRPPDPKSRSLHRRRRHERHRRFRAP